MKNGRFFINLFFLFIFISYLGSSGFFRDFMERNAPKYERIGKRTGRNIASENQPIASAAARRTIVTVFLPDPGRDAAIELIISITPITAKYAIST